MTNGSGAADLAVGDEIEMEIGASAHGGSCVARVDGRVVFVRYALPGERALVRLTEVRAGSFCRGEAIEVLRADPRRVKAPCAHFGPGGCGGCDWQHAAADLQRELKASIVAEQLRRLAGIDRTVCVEELPGSGFGWRSRVRWALGEDAIGPRRYRSHDIVPITAVEPCLIAEPSLSEAAGRLAASPEKPHGAREVAIVARERETPVVAPVTRRDAAVVVETVRGREFSVDAAGFWQAHTAAAEVFSDAVSGMLADIPVAGGVAWDLYGGAGLFAPVLAEAVGERGSVITVESDAAASRHAAVNMVDLPQVDVVRARVDRFVSADFGAVDVVLLDPPRSGAGRQVCEAIAARRPAVIIYVACDPAALARDTAVLATTDYQLDQLRAFDAFPQTHHIECLARFLPTE